MSWKILLLLIIVYFVILVLGGLAFHYLETDDNEDADAALLAQQSRLRLKELRTWDASDGCPGDEGLEELIAEVLRLYDQGNFTLSNTSSSGKLKWDIPNSMFFAATIATTIGYGHMAPVTQIGRAFCVFYAFVSIPVCLVMLGGVGHTITQLFNKLDKKMDKCKNPKAEKITKSLRSLTTLIIGMGLFMFLPAGAFMYMEGWTYPDSLYYVFITLTTVGLGDIVAGTGTGNYEDDDSRASYQLSVALWIIFGLAWLSTVIAMAQDFFQSLVDKVDEVVMDNMKPHLQNFMDKVDDRVLSQMKPTLSTIGDRLDRLKFSSSTQGLEGAGEETGDVAPSQQYLVPDNVPNNEPGSSSQEHLPPIRVPVPDSNASRNEPTSSDPEDSVWERRRPKPVQGLPNAMGLGSQSEPRKPKNKKSKQKFKNNKVNQENGDIV